MRLCPILLSLLALACSGGTKLPAGGDDSGSADGSDGSTDGSDGSTGTDNDGDGFSVEDGDCDDDDIGVNPAREEDVFDGKDNDCDGRVDEEWSGLTVTEQVEGGASRILVFDSITRLDDSITLPPGIVPYDIDHGLDGGYVTVVNDVFINFSAGTPGFEYADASIVEVDSSGNVTPLAEVFYWFGPIVRGVKAHPGGYYVAATPGALWRIDRDGSTQELASWAWDISDDTTFELYALDLSVDLLTGEVGIQDLLGGFATWTEAGGLVQHKKADLSDGWANWDANLGVGLSRMDGDGWWGMTGDFAAGTYALERFNLAEGDWVERMAWANNLVRPIAIATDGDHGEAYVTAKGGDHRTIWRIREQGGLIDDAYDEVADGRSLWGIVSNY
jgi:hypothetical protein